MLIYEIQGKRYPSEPEADTKRKMLSKHPPDAEVIVWDFDSCYIGDYPCKPVEIERLKLNDLWNEGITDR